MLIFAVNSACVTSVLRTYYTWRVVKSHDANWNIVPMGLWGGAELSIGIIVGCLPTLHKFIQHVGTKIRLQSSGSGTGRAANPVALPPKANVFASVIRPFAKYGVGQSITVSTWNETDMPRSQHRDEYLVLDEFGATPPQEESLNTSTGWLGQNNATVREDLEYPQEKK